MNQRPVIICTDSSRRGIFFGYIDDAQTDTDIISTGIVSLSGAKMAIVWGTERGVMQLAATGPTKESRISAPADALLNGVTAVFAVTPEAEEKWKLA